MGKKNLNLSTQNSILQWNSYQERDANKVEETMEMI
jgi:hypothetical protein